MRTSTRLALPFFYAMLVGACTSNDNYPKDYMGFEQQRTRHAYDVSHEEEIISLKIVAGDKQDKDRKLTITSNQQMNSFLIKDPHPIMQKGKKSVKVDIIIYPQKIIRQQRVIHLACTPDGKDAKVSETFIRLEKK